MVRSESLSSTRRMGSAPRDDRSIGYYRSQPAGTPARRASSSTAATAFWLSSISFFKRSSSASAFVALLLNRALLHRVATIDEVGPEHVDAVLERLSEGLAALHLAPRVGEAPGPVGLILDLATSRGASRGRLRTARIGCRCRRRRRIRRRRGRGRRFGPGEVGTEVVVRVHLRRRVHGLAARRFGLGHIRKRLCLHPGGAGGQSDDGEQCAKHHALIVRLAAFEIKESHGVFRAGIAHECLVHTAGRPSRQTRTSSASTTRRAPSRPTAIARARSTCRPGSVASVQIRAAIGLARVVGDPHEHVGRRGEPHRHERRERPEQVQLPGWVVRTPWARDGVRCALGGRARLAASAVEHVGLGVEVDGLGVDLANPVGAPSAPPATSHPPSTACQSSTARPSAASSMAPSAAARRTAASRWLRAASCPMVSEERQADACDEDKARHEQHRDERHASIRRASDRRSSAHRHAEADGAIPHPPRRVVRPRCRRARTARRAVRGIPPRGPRPADPRRCDGPGTNRRRTDRAHHRADTTGRRPDLPARGARGRRSCGDRAASVV